MQKLDDANEIDQEAVCKAGSKLALLADLFSGAAGGQWLDLGPRAIDGLCVMLRECAEVLDQVDDRVAAVAIARVGQEAERRIN